MNERTQTGLFRQFVAMVVLAFGLLVAGPVAALTDCRAARVNAPTDRPDQPAFKLLLDELALPSTYPDSDLLHQALRSKLQDNVQKIKFELGEINVIFCKARKPTHRTDILDEIEGFTASNVVLEIWGFFDGDEAIFTQAVIPLLSNGAAGWPSVEQYYEDTFPYNESETILRFLKRLVLGSVHMRTYTAVGIASRALMMGDFDRARRFFCQALGMLDKIPSVGGQNPGQNTALGLLRDFVSKMSLETIERAIAARQNGGYDGNLGTPELPSGKPCLGETS